MIGACENLDAFPMRTASPVSSPRRSSGAFSATRRPASSPCSVSEKNDLRGLRPILSHLLRSQATPRPRSVLRRYPCVPGVRGPAGPLLAVRRREAGEAPLAGRQPLLHQTLRLLRRPPLPQFGAVRRGARAAPRLEDRQSPGNGV